ncbi:MAG: hypothetical protein SCH98_18465 [Deferrisomatales bacterium]|nr:hypothetical protein [Deferrisomatales bacterium]
MQRAFWRGLGVFGLAALLATALAAVPAWAQGARGPQDREWAAVQALDAALAWEGAELGTATTEQLTAAVARVVEEDEALAPFVVAHAIQTLEAGPELTAAVVNAATAAAPERAASITIAAVNAAPAQAAIIADAAILAAPHKERVVRALAGLPPSSPPGQAVAATKAADPPRRPHDVRPRTPPLPDPFPGLAGSFLGDLTAPPGARDNVPSPTRP